MGGCAGILKSFLTCSWSVRDRNVLSLVRARSIKYRQSHRVSVLLKDTPLLVPTSLTHKINLVRFHTNVNAGSFEFYICMRKRKMQTEQHHSEKDSTILHMLSQALCSLCAKELAIHMNSIKVKTYIV